jgi:ribosome-associated toxin RatA of RatAB toxin-antitoxin module
MAIDTGRSSLTGGGRRGVRRLLLLTACVIHLGRVTALADGSAATRVAVHEQNGVYRVAATFSVPQPVAVVMAVLTDYDRIPRFMPAVRTSRVLERGEDGVVVEQEAVAHFMMFAKRIHLVLEIREGLRTLRFRDRSATSFTRYEGGWTLTEAKGTTHITYELTAQPTFEVPEFLLKKLLKRDSTRMIENLQAEIAARPPLVVSRAR